MEQDEDQIAFRGDLHAHLPEPKREDRQARDHEEDRWHVHAHAEGQAEDPDEGHEPCQHHAQYVDDDTDGEAETTPGRRDDDEGHQSLQAVDLARVALQEVDVARLDLQVDKRYSRFELLDHAALIELDPEDRSKSPESDHEADGDETTELAHGTSCSVGGEMTLVRD